MVIPAFIRLFEEKGKIHPIRGIDHDQSFLGSIAGNARAHFQGLQTSIGDWLGFHFHFDRIEFCTFGLKGKTKEEYLKSQGLMQFKA